MQDAKKFACILCRRRKMKCDGARPKCMTCSRLQHQCEYAEPQRRGTHKRRNMKDLEARLKEVESLLASKDLSTTSLCDAPPLASDVDQNSMMDIDLQRFLSGTDETSDNLLNNPDVDVQPNDTSLYSPSPYASVKEVAPLGLEEPLPSQEVIDELHDIYFNKVNESIPLFNKIRYLSAMKMPSRMIPAICLRYAVWTLAASVSESYGNYEATFYERARKYAQADEMKDIGQSLGTLDHIRFWILISDYESRKMFFHRSWSSGGRAVRLAQMVGLHRLDDADGMLARKLSPADFIDLEERRRIFWTAFCADRYSCTVTGWPLAIDEKDVTTNLPNSEEAFEKGEGPATISLSAALDNDVVSDVSSYAAVVIMAALFGRVVVHLHRPNPENEFQDLSRGEFWKRHRRMDGSFSNMDCRLFILNLTMHALIVALHQAAVTKAEIYGLDPSVIRHSQAKSNAAAEEIVRVMRLASSTIIENMHPFVTFCLHMAVNSLAKSSKDSMHEYQSRRNLEILLAVVRALKRNLPMLSYVTEQIKHAIQGVECNKILPQYAKSQTTLPTSASSATQSPESNCDGGPRLNIDSSTETSDSFSSTTSHGNLNDIGLATRQFFLRGKPDLSHTSNFSTEHSQRSHDDLLPLDSGNHPGISRNRGREEFNAVQYENRQQLQQEQPYEPQQLGQSGTLFTISQEIVTHNHCTSKMSDSIPDATPQANPDLATSSNYFLNFSPGDTMPSNIFEELLAWEGNDMMPP